MVRATHKDIGYESTVKKFSKDTGLDLKHIEAVKMTAESTGYFHKSFVTCLLTNFLEIGTRGKATRTTTLGEIESASTKCLESSVGLRY